MNKKIDTEELKRSIHLTDIYEQITGNQLRRTGGKFTGLCPFHEDQRDGNFFIFEDNEYKCFTCEEKGDLIDFVSKTLNIPFTEACSYLAGNNYIEGNSTRKSEYKRESKKYTLTDQTLEIYKYFYDSIKLTSKGLAYLRGRGFAENVIHDFGLKSIDEPEELANKLKKQFSMEELISSGLFGKSSTNRPYFVFYLPCVIIPIFRDRTEPIYFSSRNLTNDKKKRFFKLHNRPQEYYTGNDHSSEYILFEAPLDAISYYQLTGRQNFIILAGLNYNLYAKIRKELPNIVLKIAFDKDERGREAENRIYINTGERPKRFDFDGFRRELGLRQDHYKDMNDILKMIELKKGNPLVIKYLINNLTEEGRERFEERAGIMEYNGNQSRPEAERNALLNIYEEL